jgi:hypothetical protein
MSRDDLGRPITPAVGDDTVCHHRLPEGVGMEVSIRGNRAAI